MTSTTLSTVVAPEPEIQTNSKPSVFDMGLFLLGSYVIALLLSTAVHELGHGLALASIPINFRLVLNPFSSSMTIPLSSIPTDYLALALSGGTVLELLFGTLVMAIFWRWQSPKLVPLLLVAPVSFLSSGSYFLVGSAIPDGDTALLIALGVPSVLIQTLGVLMLVVGVIVMILLLPLLGLSRDDSFKRVFSVLFFGMILHGFGMIFYALAVNPLEMYIGIANVLSTMITVAILTGIFVRSGSFFDRISHLESARIDRKFVLQTAGIALAFIIFELIFFN